MKSNLLSSLLLSSLLLSSLLLGVPLGFGCAPGSGEGEGEPEGERCDFVEYVAFDVANYENQQLRVGAHADMVIAMNAAVDDPGLAAAKFAEVEDLYANTASLADKVRGRADVHLAEQPVVGTDLDALITQAITDGKAATSQREVSVAKQAVDKVLTDFFFLSVYFEMTLGARDKWDEAFGYLGAAPDNAEAGARGFALVAKKRDDGNGTALRERIFNGMVDGACVLDGLLDDQGTETLDVGAAENESLQVIISDVDAAMQEVLAYSAGHEAFEMEELQTQLAATPGDAALADEMYVKLAELAAFYRPLHRTLVERGGDAATLAATIRAEIDAATADDTDAWQTTFDASGVVEALEAAFGIDVVS